MAEHGLPISIEDVQYEVGACRCGYQSAVSRQRICRQMHVVEQRKSHSSHACICLGVYVFISRLCLAVERDRMTAHRCLRSTVVRLRTGCGSLLPGWIRRKPAPDHQACQ